VIKINRWGRSIDLLSVGVFPVTLLIDTVTYGENLELKTNLHKNRTRIHRDDPTTN